jgi:hypothetical protein
MQTFLFVGAFLTLFSVQVLASPKGAPTSSLKGAPSSRPSPSVFKNISSLQKSLGFQNYYSSSRRGRPLKVAVFDKGFEGYKAQIGRTLPANTVYIPGPVAPPPDLKTEHGLRMAQILTALATNDLQDNSVIQEFYLYNVFGFSNFKAAVDDAIRRHVDVISYSEVWEYGGNQDGRGFINAQVSRATAAGITWVNAAGNFELTTYNGAIKTGKDDWVQLPDQNQALSLRCKAAKNQVCRAKVVLSWNDFKDDVEKGTNKDLDLALTDDMLNVLQASSLQQSTESKEERAGFSKYPREILMAELKPGPYLLRVKDRSHNFTSQDRLRITVDGEQITMPSRSRGESISNPADNKSVITVGALDSDRSSTSQRLGKPDILTASSVVLQDGTEFRGSSNATAIVAAAVVRARFQNPELRRNADILKTISYRYDWESGGLSLRDLYFGPTQENCFREYEWPEAPEYVRQVLYRGGVLVETTQGLRIMVPFDPLLLTQRRRRLYENDMILLLPDGRYDVRRRGGPAPEGSSEVFQRPLEAGLCEAKASSDQ